VPYRLILALAESEGSQVWDVLRAVTPRLRWPLDATTLEHLATYADWPKEGDVSWVF